MDAVVILLISIIMLALIIVMVVSWMKGRAAEEAHRALANRSPRPST